MGRLERQVAIVTGAGQGIGRGIALAFASEGARVVVAELDPERGERTAQEVRARGAEALAVRCDVRLRADIDAAVSRALEAFGGIDILVNNAMAMEVGVPLEETTEAQMALAWDSGTLGTLRCMQACFPALRERSGRIINLGSLAGLDGPPGYGSYAPAKEAIRALTRVAANEWGRHGIRVNTICPYAETPAWEEWAREKLSPAALERRRRSGALRRGPGDCEADIGRAAVFLASDDSRFVTGQTLMVDGGTRLP